jgi:alpha-tubulin suppressor-like RCC1 family protein
VKRAHLLVAARSFGLLVVLALAVPAALAASQPGAAWAWGNNSDGQLGNGSVTRYGGVATPGQVHDLAGVIALAGGQNFSLALKSDGTVWSWGNSGWGQLGTGAYGASTLPVQVSALTGITAIAAGRLHGLAVKSDGSVWGWGFNYYGQVGSDSKRGNVLSPLQVPGLRGVRAIAAGGDFSLALKTDGTVWAWGYDGLGELGNGTSDENQHPIPSQVQGLSAVTAIAAATTGDHSLALLPDETLRAWGSNIRGQLGATTTTTCSSYRWRCSKTPLRVRGLSGVGAIAAGGSHSLALKTDGTAWAWGDNGYGQLGTGASYRPHLTPAQVQGVGTLTALAGGGASTLGLGADGRVWAWGENQLGQLGIGTSDGNPHPKPAQVTGLTVVTAIAAGQSHSLAVRPST